MKKYIGTKLIEAEPMTMREADKNCLIAVGERLSKEEQSIEGYHTKYDDGVESWLPKDVFEKAYKLAETPLDRMRIESDELRKRFSGLASFIESEKFKELDSVTQGMLKVQYRMMCNYWQIRKWKQALEEVAALILVKLLNT